MFILAILVFFIGGALALFALRAKDMPTAACSADQREGALVLNNLLLVTAARDGRRRHALSDGARSV